MPLLLWKGASLVFFSVLLVLFFGFFWFVLFLFDFLSLLMVAFLRSCVFPWKYTSMDRLTGF